MECQARWQRRSLSEFRMDMEPSGDEPIGYGKYVGRLMENIYDEDKGYCMWVMETMDKEDMCVEAKRFAQYIRRRETEVARAHVKYVEVKSESPPAAASKKRTANKKVKKESVVVTATQEAHMEADASQVYIISSDAEENL